MPQLAAISADDSPVLVCINCAAVVVFGPGGWAHRERHGDCPKLVIAWPPPEADGQVDQATD